MHALLQNEGREDGEGDNMKQIAPSFNEVKAWEQPIVPKTDTVYLDLIPGKPGSTDTLLYALSLLTEFFVV